MSLPCSEIYGEMHHKSHLYGANTTQHNPWTHPPSKWGESKDQVRREFRRTKVRKATGPDAISSRLLRECADQLSEVVQYLFNLTLSLDTGSVLWKTSCVAGA